MNIKEIFSNKPRCQHFNKNGSRCQADPQTGKPYCFFHDKDPEQKQKQAAARKAGGEARSRAPQTILPPNFKPGPLKDLSQVHQFLEDIANSIISGEMDLHTGRALCYVANTILGVMKQQAREQRQASGEATHPGKKPHYDHVRVNIIPIAPDYNSDSQEEVPGTTTVSRYTPPSKPQDKDNAQPAQSQPNTVSPDFAASAKDQQQPNQPPQRHERILHGNSHFPPFIAPDKPAPPPQPARPAQPCPVLYGPDDIRKI
jgi:hypothetical protein